MIVFFAPRIYTLVLFYGLYLYVELIVTSNAFSDLLVVRLHSFIAH